MLWKEFLGVLGSWVGAFIANPLLQTANTSLILFSPSFFHSSATESVKNTALKWLWREQELWEGTLQLSGQMPRESLNL